MERCLPKTNTCPEKYFFTIYRKKTIVKKIKPGAKCATGLFFVIFIILNFLDRYNSSFL